MINGKIKQDTIDCWMNVLRSIEQGDKIGFKYYMESLNIKALRDISEMI